MSSSNVVPSHQISSTGGSDSMFEFLQTLANRGQKPPVLPDEWKLNPGQQKDQIEGNDGELDNVPAGEEALRNAHLEGPIEAMEFNQEALDVPTDEPFSQDADVPAQEQEASSQVKNSQRKISRLIRKKRNNDPSEIAAFELKRELNCLRPLKAKKVPGQQQNVLAQDSSSLAQDPIMGSLDPVPSVEEEEVQEQDPLPAAEGTRQSPATCARKLVGFSSEVGRILDKTAAKADQDTTNFRPTSDTDRMEPLDRFIDLFFAHKNS
ncbi:hypothetical protein CRE_19128 [Caenorhabditis remanei]|uniref:Uncharacterized protein n=1 Tax=Caenorhabditis remanei TaxID=31234 RepID=E3MJG6_CAERE|nr:hypothetical protein CRE_19128 [Caenorhabditis remanei]